MNLAAYDERTDNPRYERIGGEEKLLAQPALPHAVLSRNIMRIFSAFLRGKRCSVFAEVDVFFDENNHFVPDIIIVCEREKIKYNGIYGAPDLVVEILSPHTAKNDRSRKKDIYEKYGVREYWLADPKTRSLEVYHLVDGRFVLDDIYCDFTEDDWNLLDEREKAAQKFNVKVSLYDELEVSVKEVFEDMIY